MPFQPVIIHSAIQAETPIKIYGTRPSPLGFVCTPATARISADHLIGRTGFAILNGYCTVLVDGFAAGMWQLNRPASAATVTVELFRPSAPAAAKPSPRKAGACWASRPVRRAQHQDLQPELTQPPLIPHGHHAARVPRPTVG
jgi:hypothetical protein